MECNPPIGCNSKPIRTQPVVAEILARTETSLGIKGGLILHTVQFGSSLSNFDLQTSDFTKLDFAFCWTLDQFDQTFIIKL